MDNIIDPEIRVIGRRFYRINPFDISNQPKTEQSNREYRIDILEEICDYDDNTTEFNIENENGKFIGKIYVPSMFMGFVVGKRGDSKKKIEMDTKTTVIIPRMNETKPVFVKGNLYDNVVKALTQISHLIDIARLKSPFTHFLSIRASEEVKSNFIKFRDSILAVCVGDRGVCDKIFQTPEKLHLTLSMIVLADIEEINSCTKEIFKFKEENSDYFEDPINITIKGLEIMNDDPYEVGVLYGKAIKNEELDRLQNLVDDLHQYLVNKKYSRNQFGRTSIKLHMTLMNINFNESSYNDEQTDDTDPTDNRKQNNSFNCANILKQFDEYFFGNVCVNKIDLLIRHTSSKGGYYNCEYSLCFNN